MPPATNWLKVSVVGADTTFWICKKGCHFHCHLLHQQSRDSTFLLSTSVKSEQPNHPRKYSPISAPSILLPPPDHRETRKTAIVQRSQEKKLWEKKGNVAQLHIL
jgi:hypothetical protein